jgi:hypothetical protein
MKRILTLSVLIASAALFTFGQTVDGQSAHGKVEQQMVVEKSGGAQREVVTMNEQS